MKEFLEDIGPFLIVIAVLIATYMSGVRAMEAIGELLDAAPWSSPF